MKLTRIRIKDFRSAGTLKSKERLLTHIVDRHFRQAILEILDVPVLRRAIDDDIEIVATPGRPEVAVGRLQVVKVTQRTSTVRITHLEQPAIAVGQPVRRVAKMP